MPPGSTPEGLPSRQDAIAAAKRSIDAWLDSSAGRVPPGIEQESQANTGSADRDFESLAMLPE
jgi:hypothetical protein